MFDIFADWLKILYANVSCMHCRILEYANPVPPPQITTKRVIIEECTGLQIIVTLR